MSRRVFMKVLLALAASSLAGCDKPPAEDKKERPLPPDRLPPDAGKKA